MSQITNSMFLFLFVTLAAAYDVPHAEFKILSPKGFDVSIPAEENITLFAFHGKLNEEMDGLETGRWARDIVTPKSGRFVFKERETSLKIGDIIYYWTYVVYNCLGYREENGVYVVTNYTVPESRIAPPSGEISTSTTSTSNGLSRINCHPDYKVPKAEFKIFYPRGFEVSIPAEENVTLFAFHGKLNEEMNGLEAGKWARDIINSENGRFVFREHETSLQVGDIIYYWTHAVYNRLGYRDDDEVYVVRSYTPQEEGSRTTRPSLKEGLAATATATEQPLTSSGSSSKGCRPSITTTNNVFAPVCAGEIVFEENFNDDKLDSSKWLIERRFTSQPDYEFVVYLLNDEVLQIRNGMAIIRPIPLTKIYGNSFLSEELSLGQNCTGVLDTDDCVRKANSSDILPPFISSQFSTKDRFSFKYGKVEIRAKMPNAAWVFPQLFLETRDSIYGATNYQSGQMRVAFSRSNTGDVVNDLFGGVIFNANEPFRNKGLCKRNGPSVDWSADFHVYALEWLANKIVVSVDNEEYCVVEPSANGFASMMARGGKSLPNKETLKTGSIMAPFDQEFYIKLGYGIGGHNDFPDDRFLWLKEKPWANTYPQSMKRFWAKERKNWDQGSYPNAALYIDYVKVYAV